MYRALFRSFRSVYVSIFNQKIKLKTSNIYQTHRFSEYLQRPASSFPRFSLHCISNVAKQPIQDVLSSKREEMTRLS